MTTCTLQIQLDVFSPILIIPTLLVISITHHYVAWSISVLTPLCLIGYYRCWRSNPQRNRTRFFFSWGLGKWTLYTTCCNIITTTQLRWLKIWVIIHNSLLRIMPFTDVRFCWHLNSICTVHLGSLFYVVCCKFRVLFPSWPSNTTTNIGALPGYCYIKELHIQCPCKLCVCVTVIKNNY